MADLAIGISKTATQALVNKVQSAIKEEAEQWQIVQHDLVFITDEFEMMQSFLNTVMRTWVMQVRDLSYDTEDCIEFILHLDTNKSSVWLRLLPSCSRCCKNLPLDQAVTEIKQLKRRVEDVSQRSIRYRLVSDSGSVSLALQQSGSGSTSGAPGSDILAVARDTTAMAGDLADLTKLITEESNALQVLSVWGSTGDDLGTVSIIRNMYEDPSIHKDFKHRAWVKVMHPVNPHEFMRSLVVQFYTNTCQELGDDVDIDALSWTESSTGHLVKEFVQQVNKDRYLIILEGLSTMVQWDNIKPYLPDKKNGSRIVVSTRHHEVASMCTGTPWRVLELQRLSPDHSICIFFNEGFESAEKGIMAGVRRPSQTSKLVGRDSEVETLLNLIENRPDPNKPHVVSVWGIPGCGRTAFITTVYDRCISAGQFDWCATFHMPQPYNQTVFCRRLLYSIDQATLDKLKAKDPIEQCWELLHDFRGLLVIDGMQSKGDWDLIKANLITENCQSCIVVCATEESVATHCAVENNLVCSIKCLQARAALDLFQQEYQNNGDLSLLGVDNVKSILSRSGGLPRVIVALGRYLAIQHAGIRKSMCLRLMSNFMQELETKAEFASLRGLVHWLRSYFWSSSPTLMRCMLYLSIFPRGQTFRWRRLVKRWIAEGYVRGMESNALEELAGEIFKKLASQGVVQQATPATIEVWYEVSGFFHEFMISQSMEERSLFPLQVSVLDEGHRGVTTEGVGQHLAIMEKWERNKIVFDSLDFSRLRSLTVFGKWEPYFVSDKMRVLRVLDIQDSKGSLESSALDKMLQLLPRLKFLCLRASKNVTSLPESFGGLSQLQTLDIRHTDVVKLPASIMKLRKLQYIRSGTTLDWKHEEEPTPAWSLQSALSPFLPKFCKHGTTNGGVEVPRGMKNLTALHTLGVVDASAAGGKAILKELGKLTQLRKLGVSGINQENIKHLSLALVSDLQSLYLHIQKGNTAASASVGEIQLPPKLQSLKLHGSVDNKLLPSIWKLTYLTKLGLEVEELPPSISELKGRITKLNLGLNASKPEDIEVLGKLEKLHTLRLRIRKVQDDELRFCDGQDDANRSTPTLFLKLQILNIACTNRLHVRFGEGAMQKLVLLAVRCYQRPSLLQFSGLEHLFSLNQVSLGGEYDETLVTALSQQLDEHPKKPVLKNLEE